MCGRIGWRIDRMKKTVSLFLAVVLAVTAVFSCAPLAFASEFLVVENCEEPDESGLYTAQEDTTVRIADPASVQGQPLHYMLIFTLKNKEMRVTEQIEYEPSQPLRLTDAIIRAIEDGVLTQEELEGVSVAILSMTVGDEDAALSEDIRFLPAACAPVEFLQEEGQYPVSEEIGLSTQTQDAEIRYTLDGTSPLHESALFYDRNTGIVLTEDMNIRASARKAGLKSSEIVQAAYTVAKSGAVAASPVPGTVPAGTEVTLSAAEGETILYTTDGSVPEKGAAGTEDAGTNRASVTVNGDMVISARTYNGAAAPGDVQRFSYRVSGAGDTYEPNDSAVSATEVSFPAKLKATLHTASDVDYYKFHYNYQINSTTTTKCL